MQIHAARNNIAAGGGTAPLNGLLKRLRIFRSVLGQRIAKELSQDAFNSRILYRASVMTPAELAANGLTSRDVAEARAASDPAAFLLARRGAGRLAHDNRRAA